MLVNIHVQCTVFAVQRILLIRRKHYIFNKNKICNLFFLRQDIWSPVLFCRNTVKWNLYGLLKVNIFLPFLNSFCVLGEYAEGFKHIWRIRQKYLTIFTSNSTLKDIKLSLPRLTYRKDRMSKVTISCYCPFKGINFRSVTLKVQIGGNAATVLIVLAA